ncbi:RagB/SusD family nutrient uptake outer membrane protein [Spirosoma montaniterrae]|uniref:Carbohydrate-binding protein SusD n=1 Tax=Spirosoma montaniterrae TaxID=1178516 RepID=A0A1P9X2Y8_9BACT|nr:RagB/SusD family nutrient uptake outer membrane protein [Spirosoma montaniterrae]AQG81971.1 carbohydrate-binding protein SusD [Spirosoma montaniterrae]
MKKILSFLLILTGLSGCQLDETPYSAIFTDTFYKTAGDAEGAITAAYGALATMYAGPGPLMFADFSADQVYPRPVVGRDIFTLFSYDAAYSVTVSFNRANESPISVWNTGYDGIVKANWVIEKVPPIAMDTKRRDEIVGEAYFLRAYFHWMLTKNFRDVVVKTNTSKSLDESKQAISPKADVYKQIFSDLEEAVKRLPSYSATLVKGRVSKEAALALYAKAALYNESWPLALQKAQDVITSGKHSLMPDVRDVFTASKEDAARIETMFAFESEAVTPGRTSQIMGLYGPPNSASLEYGPTTFGSIFAYPAFFASFDPADKRRQLLDTSFVNRSGVRVPQRSITPITPRGVLVKKYQDPTGIGASHNINIPLLRYADVLLIAAEAEARANGPTATAYGYINQVRKRAGVADLRAGLNRDDFVAAVLQERSWELFSEGDRWYDLTRTNTFQQVTSKATNDVFPTRNPLPKHRYFPLPQDEINANPLIKQSPEWQN